MRYDMKQISNKNKIAGKNNEKDFEEDKSGSDLFQLISGRHAL